MKKLFTTLFLLLNSLIIVSAQETLSPRVTAKGDLAEARYGQPSKRGRVIFGDLVPYNEIWRAGANEATEITFKKNVSFGGQPVKAGSYSLFIIPAEKEWTIILNSQLGQWGTDYDKCKDKNVLQIKTPVYHKDDVQEKLSYTVKKDALQIEWDQTGVSIPMKAQ